MIPNQRIPINPINPAEAFAHFVQAQSMGYEEVIQELVQGRKETHWMWPDTPFPEEAYQSAIQLFTSSEDQAFGYEQHSRADRD